MIGTNSSRQVMVERRKIAEKVVVYHLPMPPSTNHLFANTDNGRVRTREYKAWIEEAMWAIRKQGFRTLHGPVKISIQLEDKHPTADCDNRIKACLDVLTAHKHGLGIIDGDHAKVLRKVSAEWANVIGAVVTIEVANG